MTLKPDCASRNSFLEATSSAFLVATVWQAAISANAAMAIAIVVSVDNFVTLPLYNLLTNPPRPRCPLAQNHRTAELRCCFVRRSPVWDTETVLVSAVGRVDHLFEQRL